MSVYGLGRFPVTLYKEQWTTLLAMTDEIRAFLAEQAARLPHEMKAAAANSGNTPKLTNQQYFEERKLLLEARVAHTVRFGLLGEPG